MARVLASLLVASIAWADDPESPRAPRFEVGVAPIVPSVTGPPGEQTEQLGTGIEAGWRIQPGFRLRLVGQTNWSFHQPKFNHDITLGNEWGSATGLRTKWSGLVGGEFIFGRGSVRSWNLPNQLSLSLTGYAGLGEHQVWLKPESARPDMSISPATFGDAGLRPIVGAGVSLRLELSSVVFIRLEARSLFFSNRLDRINGCDRGDLEAMDQALRVGKPVTSASTSTGCREETFDGTDPETGLRRSNDVPLALGIVRNPGAVWQTSLSTQLAIGAVF